MRGARKRLRPQAIEGVFADRLGYTLIEILTVIFIIAILSGIAIPTYLYYRKKAISAEARSILTSIRKLEYIYYSQKGTYTTDLNALDFSVSGTSKYTYQVVGADTHFFSARASANLDRDADLDVWAIDHTGQLQHISED